MDILLIEEAYERIKLMVEMEYPDMTTRNKIKVLMEEALPDYEIWCDEGNNPPSVVDSNNIMVRIKTLPSSNGSYNYVDVIF